MDFYLSKIEPEAGARVCIDYEDTGCTLTDLRDAISRLHEVRPDLQITIYSGNLIKEQLGNSKDELLATTSLWITQYTSADAPSWPKATWPVWTLWQYSDGSAGGSPKSLAGLPTPVDCNAFNGSRENCEKWLRPAGAPGQSAEPEPEPELPQVEIITTGSRRVIVNGQVVTYERH